MSDHRQFLPIDKPYLTQWKKRLSGKEELVKEDMPDKEDLEAVVKDAVKRIKKGGKK